MTAKHIEGQAFGAIAHQRRTTLLVLTIIVEKISLFLVSVLFIVYS